MIDVPPVDVLVIGGGPAGRDGVHTRRAPRLQGAALRTREVSAVPYRRITDSRNVLFVGSSGRLSEPFYFDGHKPHEASQTWQVLRSEFDLMMLDNAREHGVEVFEETRVIEVLFEGERAVGCAWRGLMV